MTTPVLVPILKPMDKSQEEKVHRISRRRAFDYLWGETHGLIFSVTFQKVDGSMRDMNCRRYVGKFNVGGELSYDPRSRLHVPVVDMQLVKAGSRKPQRMVNVQTLVSFIALGETYLVAD